MGMVGAMENKCWYSRSGCTLVWLLVCAVPVFPGFSSCHIAPLLKSVCFLYHTTWLCSFLIMLTFYCEPTFFWVWCSANSMLFNCILGHVLCFLRSCVFPLFVLDLFYRFVLDLFYNVLEVTFFFFNILEYFFSERICGGLLVNRVLKNVLFTFTPSTCLSWV